MTLCVALALQLTRHLRAIEICNSIMTKNFISILIFKPIKTDELHPAGEIDDTYEMIVLLSLTKYSMILDAKKQWRNCSCRRNS